MESFATHIISYGFSLILLASCVYMAYYDYKSVKRLETSVDSMLSNTEAALDSLEDKVAQLKEVQYQAFKEANTPNT